MHIECCIHYMLCNDDLCTPSISYYLKTFWLFYSNIYNLTKLIEKKGNIFNTYQPYYQKIFNAIYNKTKLMLYMLIFSMNLIEVFFKRKIWLRRNLRCLIIKKNGGSSAELTANIHHNIPSSFFSIIGKIGYVLHLIFLVKRVTIFICISSF